MTENTFHYENLRRRSRYAAVFVIMLSAFLAMVMININTGTVDISAAEIGRIIFAGGKEGTEYRIIWLIRMPRVLMAAILGGALSLSGFLLQTFFHNPVAGPYILGISSGAKMTVALVMIFPLGRIGGMSSFALVAAAFAGSLISVGFVLLVSKRLQSMSSLLVAGIMISYICSAVTDFIVTFAEDSDIVNLRGWSMGSFSGMSWGNVKVGALIIGAAFLLTFLLSKPIGAYQMGEAYARNMGVNIQLFRTLLVLLSSVLSACVTAFAGPVSFVGIAVPHLVKSLLRTTKPLFMIPGCFLGGAVFCLLCDLLARVLLAPTELSISTVTAVFGAPIVILIMVRRRKEKAE